VVAKSEEIHRKLQDELRRREIRREYLALVEGRPDARSGTIDAPIGRDRGSRTVMSTRTDKPRDAVTHYQRSIAIQPDYAPAYNNLGVIKAGQKDFKTAEIYFRQAGEWNPGLETLDRNWGMAAFYAADYQEAVAPLTRQLEKKPDDVRVRAALALSLFTTQNFSGTLDALKGRYLEMVSYDQGRQRQNGIEASACVMNF